MYRDFHYEEAVAAVDRALRYDDGLPRAWELRGLALHKLGRDRDALEAFNHALITDGGNYRIWNIRGLIQKKLHDLPGALLHSIVQYRSTRSSSSVGTTAASYSSR